MTSLVLTFRMFVKNNDATLCHFLLSSLIVFCCVWSSNYTATGIYVLNTSYSTVLSKLTPFKNHCHEWVLKVVTLVRMALSVSKQLVDLLYNDKPGLAKKSKFTTELAASPSSLVDIVMQYICQIHLLDFKYI